MKAVAVLMLSCLLVGCSAWRIQPDDSIPVKVGKVIGRVPLAAVSLGISEALYACTRWRGGSAAAFYACDQELAGGMNRFNEGMTRNYEIMAGVGVSNHEQRIRALERQLGNQPGTGPMTLDFGGGRHVTCYPMATGWDCD